MPDIDQRYLVTIGGLVASVAVLVIVSQVLRLMARRRPALAAALRRTRTPGQAFVLALVARLTVPPLLGSGEVIAGRTGTVLVVFAAAWLAAALVRTVEDLILLRLQAIDDAITLKRAQTQLSLLRRIVVAVLAVIAVGAALATIPSVRAIGASILASAGIVGLVAALAAQSALANVFAGLSVAFGNSLRVNDVVKVEGEVGTVEQITLGYVVVKLWDERRMILPTSHFTSTPFENWSHSGTMLTGTVELDVDWTVPVEELRAEARRIVEASELWDQRTFAVQVTEATGGLLRLRVLVTAATGGDLFGLRCEIREKLAGWLLANHPYALPRSRTELHDPARSPRTA